MKIPITDFVYLIPTKQFIRFGLPWVAGGVNAAVERVDGVRPTDWLKVHRAVMELPDQESA